jgi:capsular exopolysaccharide synthesis family protein
MSVIFDALQQAERERSGTEAPVSNAAELLQLVEKQSASIRRPTILSITDDVRESIEQSAALTTPAVSSVAAPAELQRAVELPVGDEHLKLFAKFQPIQVSVPLESQLPCLTESEGLAAENFRFLGVRLRHLRRERLLKKLLITSTIPHEGKSMVAANLACTLARRGQQKTLLLEGDVRRPSLSQLLGLNKLHGVCELLQNDSSQISNIYHLEGPGFWIMPAGNTTGNPLELLQSRRLPALMDQLAALFDWIVIDCPPILPLADTSVWSKLSDGILLVARQGTTDKRHLQQGLEAIDHEKLIGAVLNCSQGAANSDHYYYYRPPTVSPQNDTPEN